MYLALSSLDNTAKPSFLKIAAKQNYIIKHPTTDNIIDSISNHLLLLSNSTSQKILIEDSIFDFLAYMKYYYLLHYKYTQSEYEAIYNQVKSFLQTNDAYTHILIIKQSRSYTPKNQFVSDIPKVYSYLFDIIHTLEYEIKCRTITRCPKEQSAVLSYYLTKE